MTIILLSQLHAFLDGHGLLCKISIRYTSTFISYVLNYKCMPHLSVIVGRASYTHNHLLMGSSENGIADILARMLMTHAQPICVECPLYYHEQMMHKYVCG